MINIYIKELEKQEEVVLFNKIPKCFRNIVFGIIKKFNIVIKEDINENNKKYIIPNIERFIKNKKMKCLEKRIEKDKTKTQNVQVVLSNKMKQYKSCFVNFKVVSGKNIFFRYIDVILEKILEENKLEFQDIYVLSNKYVDKNINLIKKIAVKAKSMNIISNEVERYKTLEELMEAKGISIYVSNNKRKSLKRAKIIINTDLKNEQLKQYSINRNAIIINIPENKITNLNGFDGIIIQNIEIEMSEFEKNFIKENDLNIGFDNLDLIESINSKRDNDIKIINFYGNNGKIDEKELRNKQKILTN